MEFCHAKLITRIDNSRWTSLASKGSNLNQRLVSEYRLALETAIYENQQLPIAIVELILEMLELKISQKEQTYGWAAIQVAQQKQVDNANIMLLHCTKVIYPFIKFLGNLTNFIIIINRYVIWYKSNEDMNAWNKYCAFIIAMLYLPNWKFMSWMNSMYQNELCISGYIFKFNFFIDILWFTWFCIIAFPILVTGMFIYTTSTILFICGCACTVGWCGYCIGKCIHDLVCFEACPCCLKIVDNLVSNGIDDPTDKDRHEALMGNLVLPMVTSLFMIVAINITIFGTIQFWNTGLDWLESYRVVMTGEYCHNNDWFRFGKWSQYPSDVKFLIISWILF